MAEKCSGKVIFFSRRPDNSTLATHRGQGGRVVFVRDGAIMLCEGEVETPLLSLDRVPLTHGGRVGFQVENTLASVAAAWGLGIPLDKIRTGLESFGAGVRAIPGRFNLLEINGTTVVVDYGHNISSLLALVETLNQFPHRRRTVVYSAAGDRRDEDMIRQGEILGNHFDRVILYEDHYLRGREEGEIMALFRQGAERGKRVGEVLEVRGAVKSVESGLHLVDKDELLVVQADVIDETVEFVWRQISGGTPGREITLEQALSVRPADDVIAPVASELPVAAAR